MVLRIENFQLRSHFLLLSMIAYKLQSIIDYENEKYILLHELLKSIEQGRQLQTHSKWPSSGI